MLFRSFLNYFDSSIFVQLSFINQKASLNAVSYTHLDVYKRQRLHQPEQGGQRPLQGYNETFYPYQRESSEYPLCLLYTSMIDDIEDGKINCVVTKDYCAIIGLNQKDLENQGILA